MTQQEYLLTELSTHRQLLKHQITDELAKDIPNYDHISDWAKQVQADWDCEKALAQLTKGFTVRETLTIYVGPNSRDVAFTLTRVHKDGEIIERSLKLDEIGEYLAGQSEQERE